MKVNEVQNIGSEPVIVDRSTMVARSRLWTDGERETERLTFRELEREASSVANRLRDDALQGERDRLLHPLDLDFVVAFFDCLYAGVIAVPAYPPRRRQIDARPRSIAEVRAFDSATLVRSLTGFLAEDNERAAREQTVHRAERSESLSRRVESLNRRRQRKKIRAES